MPRGPPSQAMWVSVKDNAACARAYLGIESQRLAQLALRFEHPFVTADLEVVSAEQVVPKGFRAVGVLPPDASSLGRRQLQLECLGKRLGQTALHVQDVSRRPVPLVDGERGAIERPQQPRANLQAAIRLLEVTL